ncbi:MAG: NTP transferase domain-containing protein [Candidatus Omnitrophica bacterium]|nr:NTP transferase domain-containing protein [Candidatus Omnitrophota bacterium]
MPELRSIILAAGKGTRMKSAIPKVLHAVCGQPILRYVLDVSRAAGARKTYVVVGHQADAVRDFVGAAAEVIEQTQLLGTADAVRRVVPFLKNFSGDVLILCGDAPLLEKPTIRALVNRHRRADAVCTVLSAEVADPAGYGRIVRDNAGEIMAIREHQDADSRERKIPEINVGVYCVRSRDLLRALSGVTFNGRKKEFYLTDIVAILRQAKLKVQAVKIRDSREGLGINTRRDLALAQKVMGGKILQAFMDNGVTLVDPVNTYIGHDVKIGRDTVIQPFVYIDHDVRIGKDCQIGPFCRLRPGTRLGDRVQIGNFGEVSRSGFGDQSVMKHFGFVGDTRIGKNVNIGAGFVTANYDGKSKNKTVIGDKAFIGSNSTVVAPVNIAAQAVLGAGSVLTQGRKIPAGKVAVGVPARVVR